MSERSVISQRQLEPQEFLRSSFPATRVWIVADKHGMPICVCASERLALRFQREANRFIYVYDMLVEDESSIADRISTFITL